MCLKYLSCYMSYMIQHKVFIFCLNNPSNEYFLKKTKKKTLAYVKNRLLHSAPPPPYTAGKKF